MEKNQIRTPSMVDVKPGKFLMGSINEISEDNQASRHSLRGRRYNTINLSRPNGYMELTSMDVKKWEWNGFCWGASLKGNMTSPHSGKVIFTAHADKGFRLYIDGERVIDVWNPDLKTRGLESEGVDVRKGSIELEKGKKYYVVIEFYVSKMDAGFKLLWQGEDFGPEIVPINIFEPIEREKDQMQLMELGGSFVAPYGNYDEKPVHEVEITKGFKISQYPVTADEYKEFDPEYHKQGYATGISWYKANEYCKWLSEKTEKKYRLPTEAQWEYCARAGRNSWFGTGNIRPDFYKSNDWGIKGMNAGFPEWVEDWYGPYSSKKQVDPKGAKAGFVKVVRGGMLHDGSPPIGAFEEAGESIPGIDFDADFFYRSANRGAVAPGFPPSKSSKKSYGKVLSGELFADTRLSNKRRDFYIAYMNDDVSSKTDYYDGLGEIWSFRVKGTFTSPVSENVTFTADVHEGVRLYIDGDLVIDGWGLTIECERQGNYVLEKDKKYEMTIEMYDTSDRGRYHFKWYWKGKNQSTIPIDVFDEIEIPEFEIESPIGFRVVEIQDYKKGDYTTNNLFAFSSIKSSEAIAKNAYNKEKPYIKVRPIIPLPPEDMELFYIEGCGLEGLGNHNEAPALAVCPNGDILAVYYSAYMRWAEYYPDTPMIVTRLRYGSENWSMPEKVYNQADIVGGSTLLWNDDGVMRWFTGGVGLHKAPFRFTESYDNGQTWSEEKIPRLTGHIKGYSPQPISTAFKHEGIWYIPSDGSKKQNCGIGSLLWASNDEGETWYDTGGRSFSRHTPYVVLNDGAFYSNGGKNISFDGYQSKSTSYDKGKTWIKGKSQFPMLWTKQKSSFLRLKSGRLFFATDAHKSGDGWKPFDFPYDGVVVALSEDEGKTWHIKELEMADIYEKKVFDETMDREEPSPEWNSLKTIGYSVATHGENEYIHIATTSNHPALHFELNEAWILSDTQEIAFDKPVPVDIKEYEEKHKNAKIKTKWSGFVNHDGRFLRHGRDISYFENGNIEYEGTYDCGRLKGKESFYREDGSIIWEKEHNIKEDSYVWTQYYDNGNKKACSTWKGHKCHGLAKTWKPDGELMTEIEYHKGHPIIKEWPTQLYSDMPIGG